MCDVRYWKCLAPTPHPTCLCFVFVFLSFLFFQSAFRGRVVAISDAADDNITAEGALAISAGVWVEDSRPLITNVSVDKSDYGILIRHIDDGGYTRAVVRDCRAVGREGRSQANRARYYCKTKRR